MVVMNKRANIYDIAEAAGVSISMVSRVVNKSGYVSEEKRELVESVMKRLDYRPRHAARSLASKSHNTIGIVVNYGWAAYSQLVIGRILEGVSGWCRESNRPAADEQDARYARAIIYRHARLYESGAGGDRESGH